MNANMRFILLQILVNVLAIGYINCQHYVFELESFINSNLISKNKIKEIKISGWYSEPTKEIGRLTRKGERYIYFDEQGRIESEHFVTNNKGDWTLGYKYELDTLRSIETANDNGRIFRKEKYIYNEGILDSIKIDTWTSNSYWAYEYDKDKRIIRIKKRTQHPENDIRQDVEFYSNFNQLDSIHFNTGEYEIYMYDNDTITKMRFCEESAKPYRISKTILNNHKLPKYIEYSMCSMRRNKNRKEKINCQRDYTQESYSKIEFIYNSNGLIEKINKYHKMSKRMEYNKINNGFIEITYIK